MRLFVALICVISFVLNFCGIWWGLPEQWEPDESVRVVLSMANQKDLNPHIFIAPTLHRYVLLAALAPYYVYLVVSGEIAAVKEKPHMSDVPDFFLTNVWLIARMVSVLLGVLTVYVFYLTGREVAGERAGLISAACACLTMGFVNISHYATVDTMVIFLSAISIYYVVRIVGRTNTKDYVLSGASAGLAISTKYTAGLLMLPILAAHLLSPKRRSIIDKNIVAALFMVPLFFLVGTPYVVIDFPEFMRDIGYHKAATLSNYKDIRNPAPPYLPVLYNLLNAYGMPLFLLTISGTVYALKPISKKENGWRQMIVLYSWILPFLLVVGSWNFSPMRYIMPGTIFMVIFAGIFSARMTDPERKEKKIFTSILGFVLLYSLAYCIAADCMFVGDSRYSASKWLEDNTLPGDTIEVYDKRYNPPIPEGRLVYKPETDGFENLSEIMEYDSFLYRLKERQPDYIVLSSLYYERYLVDPSAYPARTVYFEDLLYERGDYRIISSFGPPINENDGAVGFGSREGIVSRLVRSISLKPYPEFVNPTVVILARRD